MDESEWIRHCEIVEDWADEQADTMLAELAALKERVEAKLDDPPKNSEKGKEKSKENGDGGKRYGRTEEYLVRELSRELTLSGMYHLGNDN